MSSENDKRRIYNAVFGLVSWKYFENVVSNILWVTLAVIQGIYNAVNPLTDEFVAKTLPKGVYNLDW
jgi:hypothetical protein